MGCLCSRALRQWASGAAFHAQMLVHLAGLEGQTEPQAARAALEQYREDLRLIIPAYRQDRAGGNRRERKKIRSFFNGGRTLTLHPRTKTKRELI